MKQNWKLIALFAAGGVVLSLLLGMVASNPFGVVLLRMLLSGLGAGGLGFAATWVVGRYLPGTAGVNIVLPEENPHAPPEAEGALAAEGVAEEELRGEETIGEESAVEEIPEAPAADVGPVDTLPRDEGEPEVLTAEPEEEEHGAAAGVPAGGDGAMETESAPRRRGGLDALGAAQDPETVARAVRTMIRRDQEG